ncbi:hypothetical protein BX600DRAFT_389558 [Xylariales sp. PMI_506]|nr:hypothetical protein BX600DRAFT_389558 [Xylariales sp. PMI_506]
MAATSERLERQWSNPGDILSLLLLIGGDIVQKAVAQLVGYQIRLPSKRNIRLPLTPIAFSFGWVAFGFTNLLAAVSDMRLMPNNDNPSITVNCSNGFIRETRSWVIGRLLRDHEIRCDTHRQDPDEQSRAPSIRIEVFHLGKASALTYDFVWWFGWTVICLQIGIAIVPWVLYGNWEIIAVTSCANFLVAVTCAMPQWVQEKWAGRKLQSDKVVCLTRGNGSQHVMVLIGTRGSWDIESLATAAPSPRPETRWMSLVLAVLWICLLISVSGLQDHTWFLVGIGTIGMLQNLVAAGVPRDPSVSDFHLTRFERAPIIIGYQGKSRDDRDVGINLEEDLTNLSDIAEWALKPVIPSHTATTKHTEMPSWLKSMSKDDGVPEWLEPLKPDINSPAPYRYIILATGVHGALIELEKWVPTAGLAMVQVLFPGGLKYNDASIRDNSHKKFWKRAYHTVSIRKRAEEKRREEERSNLETC